MGTYVDIDNLLDQGINHEFVDKVRNILKDASRDVFIGSVQSLLRKIYLVADKNGNDEYLPARNGINQILQASLRNPFRAEQFAIAVSAEEQRSKDLDITVLIQLLHLDDFQASLLATGILVHAPADSKVRQQATNELMARFQVLVRHIGIKSQTETSSVDDIACIARQLLLNTACSNSLSAVQKFVVEYALFQRFQIDMPDELVSFFSDYNLLRREEDQSKSLAQLFDETRGAATTTLSSVTQIFNRLQITPETPEVEEQIADLIVTLINSACPKGSWSGEKLGHGIHKVLPNLNWILVLGGLDREDLEVVTMDDLKLLLAVIQGALSDGQTDIPVHLLWGTWRNTRSQASLLNQLTQATTSTFNITEFGGQKVLTAENFVAAPAALKNLAAQLETSPWNSLDLLQTSLRLLSDEEAAQETKYFLEAAGKSTPELIFLGCIQLARPWGVQQEQLSEKGFEVFFSGQPNHQLVFYRLWQVDPEFLCRKFVEYHGKDSVSIDRILDIAQDLRILDQLLNLQPYSFSIDLAASASKRDYVNIEKWLDHHISAGQDPFIDACLRYLSFKAEAENMMQQTENNSMSPTAPLKVETVAVFLKALMNTAMSPENGEYLKQVQTACLQVYPRLMNSTNANRDPIDSNNFAKDVEKEVEFHYGRLYEGEMSITSFVSMLHSLKSSHDVRDQDVFACMLHSLFDEYRFFADYPISALNITAILFGSLIQNQLLSYIPLGIALRYILDAVGHDADSNMFKFGVQALSHFKDRVPAWPQYCEQILAVPSLVENEPELIHIIRSSEQRNTKSNLYNDEEPSIIVSHLDRQPSIKPPFASLHAGIGSRDTTFAEPPMEASDKILFNINNMSLTNLSEKLEEVKSVLMAEHYGWFACHLVSQRAAVEPNYHSLYIHFLEAMQNEILLFRIVQETIENICLLLNSDSTITSTVERTNLKNLGSWLGGLTLSRNKPLKHKMISLKDLLLEGFDGNRLIVVLPFVCRVLEQTVNSKVFRPPCPWTMGILGLLMELYESADMKLNLKFEVEVLCKKLGIAMSDIEVSSVLRSRPAATEPSEFLVDGLDSLVLREDAPRRGQADLGPDQTTAFVTGAVAGMPITIHPVIQQNFAVPNLRRLLIAAAERAVREFILPVVERSVAVASISTSQLVSKDFALEEDINKFRRAAHTMNQNLAGSLALVTCKEPLRNAFTNNLRILLAQSGFEGLSQEGETLLAQLISDNLDVACMIVEKAATERAITEIDEGLATGYQARRKHFESRSGQNFSDVNAPRHAFPLPGPLRLKASGLTAEQMSTYDDFTRIPRTAQDAANYYSKDESRASLAESESSTFRNDQLSASAFEQLCTSLIEVDALARDSDFQSLEDIPSDSPLRISLQQIPLFLSGLPVPTRDERTLTCSQRVCQLLFKIPYHDVAAQCLTLLLNNFIELSMKTFRDVSIWLVHSEDPRKYNIPVIQTLMRAQIIVPSEFDVQLAKQITLRKPAAVDFALGLIAEAVLGTAPVALRTDFTSSLDALDALSRTERVPVLSELFEHLRSSDKQDLSLQQEYTSDDVLVKEQLCLIFMEWVHLISHPATTDKIQLAYVLQLQRSGITSNDDLATLFFRCTTEQSIESAIRMMPVTQAGSTAHYLVIDALVKLIILMLKCQTSQAGPEAIAANFKRAVDIILIILIREHDIVKSSFNQKPFFRLFASILSELHASSNALLSCMPLLLTVIANALQVLQPLHYPAFAFGWMTLISHRLFMPKLLQVDEETTWPIFRDLVSSILRFLAPYLGRLDLPTNIRVMYHATLRMLLVLLNDFPSFLDEFHYTFMNVVPDGCIQLRNLILSAFPRKMLLPDPFLPGLKVDRLPETANAPRIRADLEQVLIAGKVLNHVHNYIYSLNPVMVQKIVKALTRKSAEKEPQRPDTTLINTLILHCGVQAMGATKGTPTFEVNSPWVSLLHELFKSLGPAGRYRMLGAIANQLRYPNCHTYFFSCVLLLLFSNGGEQEALVKEQITRVLLERLICNRPHPWGLLITFTELLKNSKYAFWELKFIRTSSEIETLFQSLAHHINQNIIDADNE